MFITNFAKHPRNPKHVVVEDVKEEETGELESKVGTQKNVHLKEDPFLITWFCHTNHYGSNVISAF